MDNRITKKRLSDMIAYEWIIIAAVILAAIFILEMAFSVFSVKPTTGQQFRLFYDINVSDANSDALLSFLDYKKTFSYDVLDVASEKADASGTVLSSRDVLLMGDVIVTDRIKDGENPTRAENLTVAFKMYSFDKLFSDSEEYLKTLLLDGAEEISVNLLDGEKIKQGFISRNGKDNRFRTQEQKDEGISLENERIAKLVENTKALKTLLDYDDYQTSIGGETLFYRVAVEGKGDVRYGLKADSLKGGNEPASKYFSLDNSSVTSENVVLLVFDRKDEVDGIEGKGVLQFEDISFIIDIVKNCSNLLQN